MDDEGCHKFPLCLNQTGSSAFKSGIDRDGTKDGYDIELPRAISEQVGIPVITSGGVGTLEHLYEGLIFGKTSAVLAASIFHYLEFTISQVKLYLKERGVIVRLSG